MSKKIKRPIGRGLAVAKATRSRPQRTRCTYPWCDCAGPVGDCPEQSVKRFTGRAAR